MNTREKQVPPIEVKSKVCSCFLSYRMVDIIGIIRETLKKHTIKFRTTKKVHLSTTVNNKYFIQKMSFKDPVCNMMVDERKAQHISEIGGKKIYLCSAACKNQFEEDPKKYGY